MVYNLKINIDDEIKTCFDCPFSKKEWCWARCPFLNTMIEDERPRPKKCPLKKKNENLIYEFNKKIYKETT
jgi:hypothetical protein